jgi:hypothetical protein
MPAAMLCEDVPGPDGQIVPCLECAGGRKKRLSRRFSVKLKVRLPCGEEPGKDQGDENED